jgi:thiol-disulfide isomerase/thioredoxin
MEILAHPPAGPDREGADEDTDIQLLRSKINYPSIIDTVASFCVYEIIALFNAQHDLPALAAHLQAEPDAMLIACFCAEWCKTCQQYQPAFEALATQFPQACLIWIDIEEQPELLGDEDIEDFPTLLIQNENGTVFYGPMLPHIEHLERLVHSISERSPVLDTGPGDLRALVAAAA